MEFLELEKHQNINIIQYKLYEDLKIKIQSQI